MKFSLCVFMVLSFSQIVFAFNTKNTYIPKRDTVIVYDTIFVYDTLYMMNMKHHKTEIQFTFQKKNNQHFSIKNGQVKQNILFFAGIDFSYYNFNRNIRPSDNILKNWKEAVINSGIEIPSNSIGIITGITLDDFSASIGFRSKNLFSKPDKSTNSFIADSIQMVLNLEERPIFTYSKLNYIEIPVKIGYNLTYGNVIIQPSIGISYNILTTSLTQYTSNYTGLQVTSKSTKQLTSSHWNYIVSINMDVPLTKNLFFRLSPYYTQSITSLYKNKVSDMYYTIFSISGGFFIQF